jgi:hypothetical protein
MTGSAPWARTRCVTVALRHELRRARESWAPLSTRLRAPAGARARSDITGTSDGCRASAGRPPGEGRPNLFQRCPAPARAKRRNRWGRPPEVAEAVRGRQTHQATAGRRAGAEARQAPNVTAGRCVGDSGPAAGSATADSAHRHGHGNRTRSSVTVSVTDEADSENHGECCGKTGTQMLVPKELSATVPDPLYRRCAFETRDLLTGYRDSVLRCESPDRHSP